MFSFFRPETPPTSKNTIDILSVFSDEDVKFVYETLNREYPPDNHSRQDAPEWLPSRSKSGILKSNELTSLLKQQVSKEQGKIPVLALADEIDAQESDIQRLVQKIQLLTTKDRRKILSVTEMRRIAFVLERSATSKFVNLNGFCNAQDLDHATLMTLLRNKSEDGRDGNLEYHAFGQTDESRYCVSPSIAGQFKSMIMRDVRRVTELREEISWPEEDLFGLPTDHARIFVNSILSSEQIAGQVTDLGKTLLFTPQSFLDKSKYQRSDEVLTGKLPSLPLTSFSPEILREHTNLELQEDMSTSLESSPYFTAHGQVVSSKYLRDRLSHGLEVASAEGLFDLQSTVESLPPVSREESLRRVQQEATRRSTSGEHGVFDNYVVSSAWLGQQRLLVQMESAQLASSMWAEDNYPKSKTNMLKSKLREHNFKILAQPSSVFEAIWTDPVSGLAKAALETCTSQFEALEQENEKQFRQFWSSRVDDKAQLYATGVNSIAGSEDLEGPLSTQLNDLLRNHLEADLVPLAVSRAKTKGLTRSPQLKLPKKFSNLESTLAQAKDLDTAMQALSAFDASVGIAIQSNLKLAKQAMLEDMVKTMKKDADAPRLFLMLIIILIATEQEGVVYATGKLAPKLLKHVKEKLEPEVAARLEQLKNSIKSGKITEEEREEMRSMAANVIASYES